MNTLPHMMSILKESILQKAQRFGLISCYFVGDGFLGEVPTQTNITRPVLVSMTWTYLASSGVASRVDFFLGGSFGTSVSWSLKS